MHDPMTQICSFPSYDFQQRLEKSKWFPNWLIPPTIFTLWHNDPCKGPGGDDSCGWFMRAYHGDQKTLEKIVKNFEYDFDGVFKSESSGSGQTYFRGLFKPNGDPHFSVQGIVLNLFYIAAIEHFKVDGRSNWYTARKWMRKNLFDILIFAENPTDSLFDGITRKFQKGCGEEYTEQARRERIRSLASCIYGWIIRETRPWYKHPRWHIHHWSVQIHHWQLLKRWITRTCKVCGRHIRMSDHGCVSDGWSEDSAITCGKCSSSQVAKS